LPFLDQITPSISEEIISENNGEKSLIFDKVMDEFVFILKDGESRIQLNNNSRKQLSYDPIHKITLLKFQ